jgi:hypothetical protein
MNFPKTTERRDVVEAIQKAAKIHAMNQTAKSNSFPLRPSSALKSKRELYYGLVNYFKPGTIPVNPNEGRNTMLLALGHSIERHFVEFIERAYAIPYRNLRVNFGELQGADGKIYPLNGELDFIIQSTVTGEMIIADSKSSADFPFKSGVPKEDHIAQINLYMHSDWARARNINKAWILYYNKNNSELKAYEFGYSKELAEEVIDNFNTALNIYLQGLPIPTRVHVLGCDWQAAYSSYRDYDNREFSIPVTERATSKLEEDIIEDMDRKELVKYLAIRPDSGNMFVTGNRRLWLELGSTTLILKEEKIK